MRSSEQIIDYIFEKAEKWGWTQKELAEKVGMPESTLSRYKNHQREFPTNDIEKFAKAFDCSVEELLGLKRVSVLGHTVRAIEKRMVILNEEMERLMARKRALEMELEQLDVLIEETSHTRQTLRWIIETWE